MESSHGANEQTNVKDPKLAEIERKLRRLRFQNYTPRAEQLKQCKFKSLSRLKKILQCARGIRDLCKTYY